MEMKQPTAPIEQSGGKGGNAEGFRRRVLNKLRARVVENSRVVPDRLACVSTPAAKLGNKVAPFNTYRHPRSGDRRCPCNHSVMLDTSPLITTIAPVTMYCQLPGTSYPPGKHEGGTGSVRRTVLLTFVWAMTRMLTRSRPIPPAGVQVRFRPGTAESRWMSNING